MAIGVTPPLTLSRYRDLSDEVFVLPLRSRNDIAINHQGSAEPYSQAAPAASMNDQR